MRITIGGVLLLCGVAAVVVVGPFKLVDPSLVQNQIDGIKDLAKWVGGYLNFSKTETPPVVESVAVPVPEEPLVPPPVDPVPPPPEPAPVEPVAAAVPVEVVKPAEVAVVKKRSVKRRRTKKAKPAVVAPAPKAKKSAGIQDKLVGSYVSLKLKSGREVKGVLQARTATQYTIEIPGMGPFQYPVDNVTSISAVE